MQTTDRGSWIVITGATSGIGLATTRELHHRGFRVIGMGRNEAVLDELRSELGDHFEGYQVDLEEASAREETLAQVVSKLPGGRLHGLINNAGICTYSHPTSLDVSSWSRLLEVNVQAVAHMCHVLVPHMAEDGHIVNIGSVTADFIAGSKFAPYAVTKSALKALTQGLRLELSSRGLRICLVSPGLVDTDIYRRVENFESTEARLRKAIPQWLQPSDVASAIAWIFEQPGHIDIAELKLVPRFQPR